MKLQYHWIK